jgi:hypothetical protein
MKIESFRNLIKECLVEVSQETNKKSHLKESLRKVVKDVLNEISNVTTPEPESSEKEKVQKGFAKNGNEREDISNDEKVEEIESIVHGFDPTWKAYMDDHGQIVVRAHNMLYIRIVQKFENNYDVDAMVKLVDRVRAIGLDWDQVKAFVKVNFKDLKTKAGNKTVPDKMKDRSLDHYKDRDQIGKMAGPDNSIENRGEKNNGEDAKIKDTPNKHKDFNEPAVKKDEDKPDQPMKAVTKQGEDPKSLNKNIEKTDKVKSPKHDKSPTDLKSSDKKTTKFRPRK